MQRFLACLVASLTGIAGLPTSTMSTTWYLTPAGPMTIQQAINSAAVGDTVLLGPGTYTGAGNRAISLSNKTIVITSTAGPEMTIIDCEDQTYAFSIGSCKSRETVLSGVTIKDGSQTARDGGAMKILGSSLTIENNIFLSNEVHDRYNEAPPWCSSGLGGAVYVEGGAPLFENNIFRWNKNIGGCGGALFLRSSSAEFIGNMFSGNGVDYGCIDVSNPAHIAGGAIYIQGGRVLLLNNTFCGNYDWSGIYSGSGAAISYDYGTHTVRNCTFCDNYIGYNDVMNTLQISRTQVLFVHERRFCILAALVHPSLLRTGGFLQLG